MASSPTNSQANSQDKRELNNVRKQKLQIEGDIALHEKDGRTRDEHTTGRPGLRIPQTNLQYTAAPGHLGGGHCFLSQLPRP